MTGRQRVVLTALLVAMGCGWGLTIPLGKIAVSDGKGPLGLIFWQLVIVSGVLTLAAGRGGLGLVWRAWPIYLLIAAFGTILPNLASLSAAVHLQAGVMALTVSLVPLFAFPIALFFGTDSFALPRLAGLACGAVAVALLVLPDIAPWRDASAGLGHAGLGHVGLAQTGLAQAATASLVAAPAAWVLVALAAPLCYAVEGNAVARWGTFGLDPVQVLAGASLLGVALVAPLALVSGQWINPVTGWGPDLAAHGVACVIHAAVYTLYVWMVRRAGAVFAAQVAYLVTGSGVLWSMLLLSERYDSHHWMSLGLFLAGLFLVQPRQPQPEATA